MSPQIDSVKSFRDYRTLSMKQRISVDFLTRQAPFDKDEFRQRFVFYGGAGWGGKSYLIRSALIECMMVLRDLGFPGKSMTIYTMTYPDLTDRHIRKFETEFAGLGEVKESKIHGLHFRPYIPGIGVVYLRNIASDTGVKARSKRGAESIGAGVDELTELPTYEQLQAILYQTRPDSDHIPFIPVLLGSNPDGPGHTWVKEVFHPQYRDLGHPFYASRDPRQVLFVPALKTDNPAYEYQKDIVDANLQGSTDPDLVRARNEGAWDLYASGRFPMFRESVHGFDDDDLLSKWGVPYDVSFREFLKIAPSLGFVVMGSLDYGTSLDGGSSYQIHLIDPDNNPWTVDMMFMQGMQLPDQAAEILRFEKNFGPIWRRYCDPALQGKVAEDPSRLSRLQKFANHGVRFILGENDRCEGAATIEELLWYRKGQNGHQLTQPRWRIHRHRCKLLLKQLGGLPRDPRNPEDVDPMKGIWHHYDSARYGLHTRFRNMRTIKRSSVVIGSSAWLKELTQMQERKQNSKWM